jgi:hypothetical protein
VLLDATIGATKWSTFAVSLFKRLTRLFAPSASSVDRSIYPITAQCSRCGEIISTPVDMRNDLSAEYDEATGATTYISRKVLMGRQRCFQQIEVTLRFDGGHKLLDREITGGKFVEAEPP